MTSRVSNLLKIVVVSICCMAGFHYGKWNEQATQEANQTLLKMTAPAIVPPPVKQIEYVLPPLSSPVSNLSEC